MKAKARKTLIIFVAKYKQNGGGMMAEVAVVTPGSYYLSSNHQPMPLTNFSSIARDITPGYLTISANKPKVAPTENVTITASGCYFGRVVWRAGTRIIENPAATIPSITEVGPGYYQAICVGDPTVTQDWVTVMIDPITDIVPIPTGPAYACANQSITLTGTAAPSGYTYKWYVLKPADKEYFFSNRSSTNLFENAPQIFNITQNANVTVTGPGLYFLQCISPNGWKSQVREFKVDTVFAAGLKAFNNGPVEPGNPLVLSTGAVPAATSYAWTGPNGFTASGRTATISSFADSLAGTYHLTITATGGCTFTDSTVVEASNCDIYVLSRAANGDTTSTFTRIGNSLDQFQPLTLTVSPFEGTNNFSGYKIQWMYNGSAIAGATSKTLSASKPGEYRAVLTLKSNVATICEAVINLSGAPCKIFELDLSCQVPNNITLPNAVATGVQLAVGDEFTAGDYTVVVTEIISGSPAGWKGKGYVKMKLVAGIVLKQISVNFENAVVNECYELASGSVVTDYDPGNVFDVDQAINDLKSLVTEIRDLLDIFDNNYQTQKKLDELIELKAKITNSTFSTNQFDALDNIIGAVSCLVPRNPNARVSTESCSIEEVIEEVDKNMTIIEDESNIYPDKISATVTFHNSNALSESMYLLYTNNNDTPLNKTIQDQISGRKTEPVTNMGKDYFIEMISLWNLINNSPDASAIMYHYMSSYLGNQSPVLMIHDKEMIRLNKRRLYHLPGLAISELVFNINESFLKNFFLNKIRGNATTFNGGTVNLYRGSNSSSYIDAGEKLLNNFFSNSGNNYYETETIAKAIYNTVNGKKFIKNTIKSLDIAFNKKIGYTVKSEDSNPNFYKTNFQSIFNSSIEESKPGFGIADAIKEGDEGLVALLTIGGTQGIEIRLKNFTPILGSAFRGYNATVVVQLRDTFGVSEDDFSKNLSPLGFSIDNSNFIKYNYRAGVLTQWILQHQYGYKPFKDFLTYEINMQRTWETK